MAPKKNEKRLPEPGSENNKGTSTPSNDAVAEAAAGGMAGGMAAGKKQKRPPEPGSKRKKGGRAPSNDAFDDFDARGMNGAEEGRARLRFEASRVRLQKKMGASASQDRGRSSSPSRGSTSTKHTVQTLASRATPNKKSQAQLLLPGRSMTSSSNAMVKKKPEPGSGKPEFQLVRQGQKYIGRKAIVDLIESAPAEEQLQLIDYANGVAEQVMDAVAEEAADWYSYQKEKLEKAKIWNEEAFADQFPTFSRTAKDTLEARNKKGQGVKRVEAAWGKDPRGQLFIKNQVPLIKGDTVFTKLGTIATDLDPENAIRLLNQQIVKRGLEYFSSSDKRGKPKFGDPGDPGARLRPGDISAAWSELNALKKTAASLQDIARVKQTQLKQICCTINSVGLVEAPAPGAETQFLSYGAEPDAENPFVEDDITARAVAAADQQDDQLSSSPAQEETPVDPNAQPLENDAEALREARAGKRRENSPAPADAGTLQVPADLPASARALLNLVHETVKMSTRDLMKGSYQELPGAYDEAEGRAAQEAVLRDLIDLRDEGEDLDAIAKKGAEALLKPGSAKKNIFNRKPQQKLNVTLCSEGCMLSDATRNVLENGHSNFVFVPLLERLNLYDKVMGVADTPPYPACPFHVRKFAEYLELDVKPREDENMIRQKIERLRAHGDNIGTYRLGEGFRDFKTTTQAKLVRRNVSLGASKYLPAAESTVRTAMASDDANRICGNLFKYLRERLDKNAVAVANWTLDNNISFFTTKWMVGMKSKKPGPPQQLAQLIDQEIKMYAYHCRESGLNTNSFFLANMVYSVFQQLIRGDIGFYLANVAARGDGKTALVAYPDGIRYVPAVETGDDSIAFAQVDLLDRLGARSTSTTELENRICDFHLVSASLSTVPGVSGEQEAKVDVIKIPGGVPPYDLYSKAKRNARFYDLFKPGSGPRLMSKLKAKLPGWSGLGINPAEQSLILTKQGVPISFNFVGTAEPAQQRPLIVVSANLTAIEDDGDTLENGASWATLHRQINMRQIPEPRWFDPKSVEPTSEPFKSAMSLIGANPVSEAVLGRLSWTDPSVIAERDRLFTMDPAELVKYVTADRKERTKRAIVTLEDMFKQEKLDYKTRSFGVFAAALSGDPQAQPPQPDPQYPPAKVAQFCEEGDFKNDFDEQAKTAALSSWAKVGQKEEKVDEGQDDSEDESLPKPGSNKKRSQLTADNLLHNQQYLSTDLITDSDKEGDVPDPRPPRLSNPAEVDRGEVDSEEALSEPGSDKEQRRFRVDSLQSSDDDIAPNEFDQASDVASGSPSPLDAAEQLLKRQRQDDGEDLALDEERNAKRQRRRSLSGEIAEDSGSSNLIQNSVDPDAADDDAEFVDAETGGADDGEASASPELNAGGFRTTGGKGNEQSPILAAEEAAKKAKRAATAKNKLKGKPTKAKSPAAPPPRTSTGRFTRKQ